MTQLSPTAQDLAQVLMDAAVGYPVFATRKRIAAAIRSLVEQTLPEEPNWADSDYDHEVWSMMQSLRTQQLAVAAELEGVGCSQ
jgi:hypothetical protein